MPEEKNYDNYVLGASGLAAASPFAGLIGQRKLVNDPFINKSIERMSLDDLADLARKGDIIVSAKPMGGLVQGAQHLSTGSPFYHVSPVVGADLKGRGRVLDAGDLAWSRAKPSVSHMGRHSTHPTNLSGKDFKDFVLLRPDKPYSKEQLNAYLESMAARSHSTYKPMVGKKSFFADMFLPKIRLGSKGKSVPVCAGDSCSTFPARAMEEAGLTEGILKGKKPADVLPADFMRRGSGFTPVAASIGSKPNAMMSNRALRTLMRYGSRAGLGLGLGGTIYGTYKEPEIAMGIGAGMLTPSLIRSLSKRVHGMRKDIPLSQASREVNLQLPKFTRLLNTDNPITGKALSTMKKRLLTRTAPTAILGGLGMYGAAKGLGSLLGND